MVKLETVDRIFDLASKMFRDQKDFAAALGVSTTMVSAWRRGISQSYKRRLPQIAEVLNTTAGYLLGEEKPTADGYGLSEAELAVALAYRAASVDDRAVVDAALRKYKASP